MTSPSSDLFKKNWYWIIPPSIFVSGILLLHKSLRYLKQFHDFDMDNYWPISIFLPKVPSAIDSITLIGIGLMAYCIYKYWDPKDWKLSHVIVYISSLIIATNALQGFHQGFIHPEGSEAQGYYHYSQDAQGVTNFSNLMRTYTLLQPMLRDHTRVHPPGPLLTSWVMQRLNIPVIGVGIVTLALSLLLLPTFYAYMKRSYSHESSILATLLLGVLPGVQIYFFYSIDAVICMVFFLTFYFFTAQPTPKNLYLTIALLSLSSFMTFGVAWLVACMCMYEWCFKKDLKYTFKIILYTTVVYVLFYLATGFNYYTSFKIAASFEGSEGFYAFTKPLSYLITRVEDLLDIAIFTSPYILWIMYTNLKKNMYENSAQIGVIAMVGFGLFLLAGAYYTGETGRAAQFLYPYIILCATPYITHISRKSQKILIISIIAQTTVMQMFGFYVW